MAGYESDDRQEGMKGSDENPSGLLFGLKQTSDELDKLYELVDMLMDRLEPVLKSSEMNISGSSVISSDKITTGAIQFSPSSVTQQISTIRGRVHDLGGRLQSLRNRVDI